jgi:hypothetical protein
MTDRVVGMIMSFVSALDDSINNVREVLTDQIFSGPMYDLVNNISVAIRPIAISILGLCFVIEFLKIVTHDDILKWQTGFKIGAKLVLTYVALDLASDLMKAIYATGGELINQVNGSGASSMAALVDAGLHKALDKLNLLQAIGMLATIGIGFLIIWLTGIIILVMAYGRTIELLLHIAIAPIPCAFLILEDHHSRLFWKFIMSFAANCLQGFFIVLSIALYNAMVKKIMEEALKDGADLGKIVGGLLLGAIVLLVTVTKSGSIAKSILDA